MKKQPITALDLSKVLDGFKDSSGNFDKLAILKVAQQFSMFGSFYQHAINQLNQALDQATSDRPFIVTDKAGYKIDTCGPASVGDWMLIGMTVRLKTVEEKARG